MKTSERQYQHKMRFMADIIICEANLEDASEVTDVYLASRHQLVSFAPLMHSDEEVRQWIEKYLIPHEHVTVAKIENKIVGMCVTSLHSNVSWIEHLYLDPDYIRKGIGTSLLLEAIERLKKPIRLYTFQENELAKQFYKKYGFRAVAFGDGTSNEEGVPDILYELV